MDTAPDRPPGGVAPPAPPMTDAHLSAEALAGYADGRLTSAERAATETHLLACADCRAELVAVSALVADAPAARARRWPRVAVGLAAAAAVAFVFVPRPHLTDGRAVLPTAERAAAPNAATIDVVSPPLGGIAAGRLSVAWRAVDRGATYRVTISDTTGATRWSGETTDTALVVPDGTRLEPGHRFYLYVDAQRTDGWALTSGPHEFTTAR